MWLIMLTIDKTAGSHLSSNIVNLCFLNDLVNVIIIRLSLKIGGFLENIFTNDNIMRKQDNIAELLSMITHQSLPVKWCMTSANNQKHSIHNRSQTCALWIWQEKIHVEIMWFFPWFIESMSSRSGVGPGWVPFFVVCKH